MNKLNELSKNWTKSSGNERLVKGMYCIQSSAPEILILCNQVWALLSWLKDCNCVVSFLKGYWALSSLPFWWPASVQCSESKQHHNSNSSFWSQQAWFMNTVNFSMQEVCCSSDKYFKTGMMQDLHRLQWLPSTPLQQSSPSLCLLQS